MQEKIHLFQTNDIHSHFENWPKIRRWLEREKKSYEAQGESVFLFDIGDFLDREHPLTDVTNGSSNIELMNQAMYSGVTIGNNEGITNSKEVLNHLYQDANFPVVLSNLLDKQTQKYPSWLTPTLYLNTKQGTKIGVIGLTAPMTLTYEPFGWQVLEVDEVLSRLVPQVSQTADVLILLSHLGLPEDKRIAEKYPEINVIMGAHTHHLLANGLKINQTILASSGRFGEYVSDITIDLFDHKIANISVDTYNTMTLDDVDDQKEIKEYYNKGYSLLSQQKICHLDKWLDKEESLITTTLTAMKEVSHCDVAIVNSGLFLKSFGQGIVTAKDLHDSLPHPMNLIKVTLDGQNLIRLAKEIEKNKDFLRRFPVVGMKFRGKYFGEIWYDGFEYDAKIKSAYWCGELVKKDKSYTFVTVDHLAFLPFFPTIEIAGDISLLGPKFLRNILGEYLKKKNQRC